MFSLDIFSELITDLKHSHIACKSAAVFKYDISYTPDYLPV